jgi:hypothetical protein
MNALRHFLASALSRRLLCAGVLFALALTALITWAAKRETAVEKQIRDKVAQLQAAGEPLTGARLAQIFPDPPADLDAGLLLSNALEFAEKHKTPAVGPFTGGTMPPRGVSMDEQTLSVLRRHWEDCAPLTNLLPGLPAGARFAGHWERGILDAPVVSFVKIRSLAQVLATRAAYAADVGDAEGASRMLEYSFRFADAIPSEATLVQHMIHKACVGLVCAAAERCLNRVTFSDEQLERILSAIPPPRTNGFVNTLRFEHALGFEVFTAVKAGRSLDSFMGSAKNNKWWERLWRRLRLRRDYSDRDFLAYLNFIEPSLRAMQMPPTNALVECTRLLTMYQSQNGAIGRAVMPHWTKALGKHHEIQARLNAVEAALKIERFRTAHDRQRPASLAAAGVIALDPFDSQPLRFKTFPNGYVIYSIGLDGVDSGGTEPADVTITIER